MTSVACPHFDVSIRQRSKGQSAVAGAAYMSAEKLFCEYDQRTKNFCYKQKEIVAKGILLPPNAPREYTDRQTLWNAVEASEKQWNAQLARGIIMALPRELPADQYESLVREYCMEQFVLRGMIVDYAIHDKGDGNPHAHVMLTMRAMDEHGKWLPKARRVYILDENGEPVIGASVAIQGTTLGSITNIDGEYTLANVPENAEVTISFIGYQTLTFKANDRALQNVTLKEDSEMLDEVVVVGYGVQRKRDVTTSISSMKASELAVPVSSVDQALVGKMTGVQVSQPNGIPGGGLSIKVRGSGSITAGTEPLYVVDGFPMSGEAGNGTGQNVSPLSSINMNDIESIEVLKDASAAAIYGSRGANGVVIITTKQGKEGKDMKPTVQYDGYVGFQQRTKKIDMLDAYEYAWLSYDGHNNAYLDLLESKGIEGSINDSNEVRNQKLGKKPDVINQAYLLPPEIMPYINGETRLTNTDWQDEVMRTKAIIFLCPEEIKLPDILFPVIT